MKAKTSLPSSLLPVLRLGQGFWPYWLGLLVGWVAAWLGSCWACVVASRGCAMFDAAKTWVAGSSTTAEHSGAT